MAGRRAAPLERAFWLRIALLLLGTGVLLFWLWQLDGELSRWAMLFVAMVLVSGVLLYVAPLFNPWVQAHLTSSGIGFFDLLALRRSGADVQRVTSARITAVQAELDAPLEGLAAHDRSGGDVRAVTNAMIAAQRKGEALDFATACANDLARRSAGTR